VEPGIQLCQDYLSRGALRVFNHCSLWFDGYRLYHRKDGKIVKEADDLMDATRYGMMMLRAARTPAPRAPQIDTVGMNYDPLTAGGQHGQK
jgi:hypothetical protein